jgi:tRNA 2-thiouridine synthesizing protein E
MVTICGYEIKRTSNGYLETPDMWTEEIMRCMAQDDDLELTDSMVTQILAAREYFDENSSVPPIRTFAKVVGIDKKTLFKEWLTGPMKPITKYGGLPQPTGCV